MTVHRMAPNPLKYFGVEYSIKHNSVHRSTLDNVIENNLKNLTKGRSSDFILVGLLPSREAADWYREQFNVRIAPQAQEARTSEDWQRITSLMQGLLQSALDRESARFEKIVPVKS